MWTYAFLSIAGALFITNIYAIIGDIVIFNSLLIGFVRILWGISVAWVIFACHSGFGGFLNEFLSSKYWLPAGKIGYSFYLVHPVLMYNFNSSSEHQVNFDLPHMVR